MNESGFNELVAEKEQWENHGSRLTEILNEITSRIGDAPIYVDEAGKFCVHPAVIERLKEPGNEGAYEFLLYMERTSFANPE